MSDATNTPAAPAGPDLDAVRDAAERVEHGLGVPVFFDKLAAYGIQPGDERQAARLNRLGDALLARYYDEMSKSASAAGEDLLGMAEAGLGLDAEDVGPGAGPDMDYYKRAAAPVLAQPEMRQALATVARVVYGG